MESCRNSVERRALKHRVRENAIFSQWLQEKRLEHLFDMDYNVLREYEKYRGELREFSFCERTEPIPPVIGQSDYCYASVDDSFVVCESITTYNDSTLVVDENRSDGTTISNCTSIVVVKEDSALNSSTSFTADEDTDLNLSECILDYGAIVKCDGHCPSSIINENRSDGTTISFKVVNESPSIRIVSKGYLNSQFFLKVRTFTRVLPVIIILVLSWVGHCMRMIDISQLCVLSSLNMQIFSVSYAYELEDEFDNGTTWINETDEFNIGKRFEYVENRFSGYYLSSLNISDDVEMINCTNCYYNLTVIKGEHRKYCKRYRNIRVFLYDMWFDFNGETVIRHTASKCFNDTWIKCLDTYPLCLDISPQNWRPERYKARTACYSPEQIHRTGVLNTPWDISNGCLINFIRDLT